MSDLQRWRLRCSAPFFGSSARMFWQRFASMRVCFCQPGSLDISISNSPFFLCRAEPVKAARSAPGGPGLDRRASAHAGRGGAWAESHAPPPRGEREEGPRGGTPSRTCAGARQPSGARRFSRTGAAGLEYVLDQRPRSGPVLLRSRPNFFHLREPPAFCPASIRTLVGRRSPGACRCSNSGALHS
jgi:hypothetical protein